MYVKLLNDNLTVCGSETMTVDGIIDSQYSCGFKNFIY